MSLSDLAHTLNVDYEHIENSVAVILKQSSSFILCNAELIARFCFFAYTGIFTDRLPFPVVFHSAVMPILKFILQEMWVGLVMVCQ